MLNRRSILKSADRHCGLAAVEAGAFHGFDAIPADVAIIKRFNTAKIEALWRGLSTPKT